MEQVEPDAVLEEQKEFRVQHEDGIAELNEWWFP
jgi:hypothetical protein